MSDYSSLNHTVWDCKYHVVFIPKCRRKVLYGKVRESLGEVFHSLAQQRECKILEGHLCTDHVHMLIRIPPKYAVSHVVGFIKGKSAIRVARDFMGRHQSFKGYHFIREVTILKGRSDRVRCHARADWARLRCHG